MKCGAYDVELGDRCGREVWEREPGVQVCKAGHITGHPLEAAYTAAPEPPKRRWAVPAWLPGTVLGAVAVVYEIVEGVT